MQAAKNLLPCGISFLLFLLLPGPPIWAQADLENLDRAVAYAKAGNYRAALPLFREVYLYFRNDPNVEYTYAFCLSEAGEDRAAIEEYQRAVGLFASPPYFGTANAQRLSSSAEYEIARILEREGNWKRALDEYRRAVAFDAANVQAYNNIGAILVNQAKDYDKALSYFETALKYAPGDAAVKKNLALCYDALGKQLVHEGKGEAAIVSFKRALDVQPEWKVAKDDLAETNNRIAQLKGFEAATATSVAADAALDAAPVETKVKRPAPQLPAAMVKEFFAALEPDLSGAASAPDPDKKVQAMLKSEPALITATDGNGETALYHAGTVEMAEALLKAGADVNARDRIGGTPLYWISNRDDGPIAKILLAHGAEVNGANKLGRTPLQYAADQGNEGIVTLLLAQKANVNHADDGGVTPLLAAAAGEPAAHRKIIELLLAAGADRNARNAAGQTALDLIKATQVDAGDSEGIVAQKGIIQALTGGGSAQPAIPR